MSLLPEDGANSSGSPEVFRFPHSLSVFFPAYNDAPSLPDLLARTFEALDRHVADYEVIVVNDGSRDETEAVLDGLQAKFGQRLRVITHQQNRGYGGALRSGFAAATKDFVFYTDGDGQYDPAEMVRLLEQVKPGVGLVNGYKTRRRDPWHRILIGALYNRFARWLFRIRLRDIDCDFRLVRRELVDRIGLESTSGTVCVELVRKLEVQAPQVVEVPVQHYPRIHGRSQFFRVASLATTFVQLWRLYWTLVAAPFLGGLFHGPAEGRPGRAERRILAAVLSVLFACLLSLAWQTGVTVDEPSHLVSAYLYWAGSNNLQPADMPPLVKLIGGWIPHLTGLPLPEASHPVWKTRSEWTVGAEMMSRMSGPVIQWTFFWSRIPFLLFPVLCAGLAWWWGRRLFSPGVGILLAGIVSLSPTVLGHGSLFKNDLAAGFAYLLFWYRAWRFWRAPSVRNGVWLGLAVLVGVSAKLSLLILVAVAPVLALVRGLTRAGMSVARTAAVAALTVAIPYLGLLVLYQGPVVLQPIPVPHRFLEGMANLIRSDRDGTGVYLLGESRREGHPLYFLVALAVKIPSATQVLLLCGLVLGVGRLFRRAPASTAFLWFAVPGVLYIALASMSSLQLGVRLVLPGLMCLFLLAGIALQSLLRTPAGRAVTVALLLWLGGRVAYRYPHYLSFFNVWSGGPEHGLAFLSDSNLDWGQSLRDLARFVEENDIPKIRLAYFGFDNPYAYIPEQSIERVVPPWLPAYVKGNRLEPSPGYWAISATLLSGQLFADEYRDYFAAFRQATPIARPGYSIYVYRFN